MQLNCTLPVVGMGSIKWRVNGAEVLNTTKYQISGNNRTLTVKSVSAVDNGKSQVLLFLCNQWWTAKKTRCISNHVLIYILMHTLMGAVPNGTLHFRGNDGLTFDCASQNIQLLFIQWMTNFIDATYIYMKLLLLLLIWMTWSKVPFYYILMGHF